VCQQGGHLLDLVALRRAWESCTRRWVTLDAPDSRFLLRHEQAFFGHGPTPRSLTKLARNLVLSWRLIRRLRPAVILTTGAALAVPFAWLGRAFGARVVYVEAAGRVDRPSLACRLIAPVANRIYVQWPDLLPAVRGARYVGRVSLTTDDFAPAAATNGDVPRGGVFVSVGTCPFPFDRLVAAADRLARTETVFIQAGISRVRPQHAEAVDYLSFDAVAARMRAATIVITHAGSGSVALARASGKLPLVVPRRPELGENVDEHQIPYAQRAAEEGLVALVQDPERLHQIVARGFDSTLPAAAGDGALEDEVAQYVQCVVSSRRANVAPPSAEVRPPAEQDP
jgi:UDP-N-acetylglucosamine transferase subunit ALG13